MDTKESSDKVNEQTKIRQICIDLCLSYDDVFMQCDNCPIIRQVGKTMDCSDISRVEMTPVKLATGIARTQDS